MCTVLLPPGDNPSAVNKYINISNIIFRKDKCVGRFGQQIINSLKVLKCGAGEGWRRSVGPIM